MHNAGPQKAQRLGEVPGVGALEASQEVQPVACCVIGVRANPLSGSQPTSLREEVSPASVPHGCAREAYSKQSGAQWGKAVTAKSPPPRQGFSVTGNKVTPALLTHFAQ